MIVYHMAVLYLIYRYMHCFYAHGQPGPPCSIAHEHRAKNTYMAHGCSGRWELAAYVLYFTVVCLADMLPIGMLNKFIANTFFLYLLAQTYHGKQGKKLLAAFLIQGMNLFCETLAVYMLYDCRVDGKYGAEMYYIIFLYMYVCERVMEKVCIKNIKEDTSLKHWDLLIFLPVIGIVMEFVLIIADAGSRYAGVAVSAGMICLNLIIFYICDELAGAYLKLKESALVEQQLESYSNQLNVVMRSEEKVRGLQHDLKNHLSEILMMAEGHRIQDIKAYVRDMQQDMTNEKEHISSGNANVDSLLNLKLEQAKSELVDVRCRVSVPQGLEIQTFDWNIILGNLMDNAIRAARESDEKLLHIKINYQRGMLFIGIKNSYKGELNRAGDTYLSTKEETADELQVHGLGIRNVNRIVEKYDGNMEISDTDGVFDVRILMYVSVINP